MINTSFLIKWVKYNKILLNCTLCNVFVPLIPFGIQLINKKWRIYITIFQII